MFACEMHVPSSTCICSSDGRIHKYVPHAQKHVFHFIHQHIFGPNSICIVLGGSLHSQLAAIQCSLQLFLNCDVRQSSPHQCHLQFVKKRYVVWKVPDNVLACSQKLKHRQGKVNRTITMTGTPAYRASFHATFSPCFYQQMPQNI